MTSYVLKVFYEDEPRPRETLGEDRGSEVLAMIPRLLARHPGCHRVRVYLGDALLFAVDCNGMDVAE
ncbi:MAG: hypothetical protein K2X07_12420 [Caulobacteraceae bacterium]|nr:hypothetical protein [Caulobacteraceae bacterium]